MPGGRERLPNPKTMGWLLVYENISTACMRFFGQEEETPRKARRVAY